MAEFRSAFYDMFEESLKDPKSRREHHKFRLYIRFVDNLMNTLDDKRVELGVSKAELARTLGVEPANIRRLFARGPKNPTLSTMVDVAFGLGLKLALVPITEEDTETVMPKRVDSKPNTRSQDPEPDRNQTA